MHYRYLYVYFILKFIHLRISEKYVTLLLCVSYSRSLLFGYNKIKKLLYYGQKYMVSKCQETFEG